MPKIPLGNILRALLPWKWLGALKGTSIKRGDWEIELNEKHSGGVDRGPTKFDKPH